jgi:putative membrane protein insertion efficiency factor
VNNGADVASRIGNIPLRALIAAIGIYRNMISPFRPPSCRFIPTCSQYAVEALTEYGLLRGSWLALRRLARCGPWRSGGWDPVPQRCAGSDGGSQPEVRSARV